MQLKGAVDALGAATAFLKKSLAVYQSLLNLGDRK